jgi:hypothetical protein
MARNTVWTAAAVVAALAVASIAYADDTAVAGPGEGAERSLALEFGLGTQGILSYEEVGVRLPSIGKASFVSLKARLASSLTWATFRDLGTGITVSLHPDVIAGVLSFGGVSPFVLGPVRMYGACELLLGYSFTPWDSIVYGTGNLIGPNFTYGVLGHFGIELFTTPSMSVYLDAGGGFKSIHGDKGNQYLIASSWLGSGFGISMGMRFYLQWD